MLNILFNYTFHGNPPHTWDHSLMRFFFGCHSHCDGKISVTLGDWLKFHSHPIISQKLHELQKMYEKDQHQRIIECREKSMSLLADFSSDQWVPNLHEKSCSLEIQISYPWDLTLSSHLEIVGQVSRVEFNMFHLEIFSFFCYNWFSTQHSSFIRSKTGT